MTARVQHRTMPLGSILDRYISAGFLRIFGISLAVITGLYLTADFFERIGSLLESGASVITVLRYFLFKAPLIDFPGGRIRDIVLDTVLFGPTRSDSRNHGDKVKRR